jgi:uncharacterized membrane protein HdeD (DUF308 family)
MEPVLVHNWWSLVLRGMIAMLVGVLTFIWPGITLQAIVLLFGAYALLDGAMNITGAWYASRARERWGALVLQGIVGIAAAAIAVLWPGITLFALVMLVAAWALVTGSLQLVAAVRLRKYITGEWLLALGGILSIAFGILVMLAPIAGALVIALWVGAYALVFGTLLVALGFRLRGSARAFDHGTPYPVPNR